MIEFLPEITIDFIRSKLSDTQIFERYLGIRVEFNKLFKSPLRNDKNPTCNFYLARTGLKFKDQSGHFHGGCFDVVMYLYNVKLPRALEIIAEDFGLITINRNTDIKRYDIETKFEEGKKEITFIQRDFNQYDVAYWNQFLLTKEILEYYNVFCVKFLWVNDKLIYTYNANDLVYAYMYSKTEIKIYFPLRKKYRFLLNTNVLQGMDYLPEKGELLIITKSYKDVMVLRRFGYFAIAPQSESQMITEEQFIEFSNRFEEIVSLYDFDLAGIRTANKMKRKYGIKPKFLTNGRFGTKNYRAKDISDFVKLFKDKRGTSFIGSLLKGIFTSS